MPPSYPTPGRVPRGVWYDARRCTAVGGLFTLCSAVSLACEAVLGVAWLLSYSYNWVTSHDVRVYAAVVWGGEPRHSPDEEDDERYAWKEFKEQPAAASSSWGGMGIEFHRAHWPHAFRGGVAAPDAATTSAPPQSGARRCSLRCNALI